MRRRDFLTLLGGAAVPRSFGRPETTPPRAVLSRGGRMGGESWHSGDLFLSGISCGGRLDELRKTVRSLFSYEISRDCHGEQTRQKGGPPSE
jgi:hypothetical protein